MHFASANPFRIRSLASYVALVGIIVWAGLLLVLPEDSRDTLIRTLALGASASVIAVPLGALAAWLCLFRGFLSRILLATLVALSLTPLVIHVSSWDAAFGKMGWITETFGQTLTPLISGWMAAVWVHGVAATPQTALMFLIVAWNDKRDFEEQASLDTHHWNVFWQITFWRYLPVALLATLWVMSVCAREIAVTDLYQIETIAEQVYLGYSLNNNTLIGSWSSDQLSSAAGLSSILVAVSIVAQSFFSLALFLGLAEFSASPHDTPRRSRLMQRRQWWLAVLLLFTLALVPATNTLTRASFFVESMDGVAVQRFDVTRIVPAIVRSMQDYADELTWSIFIATASASLILCLSITTAFWARSVLWRQVALCLLLAISFSIPGPVLGSWLASSFALTSGDFFIWLIDYTIFAPVIAATLFCWPICGLLMWCLVRRIPVSLIQGAQLDGASATRIFWEFVIKANALAILGIWMVAFTLTFGELAASSMVRPAGIDTVPRKMLGDLHAGVDQLTAGITIVITAAIFFLAWCSTYFIKLKINKIIRQ